MPSSFKATSTHWQTRTQELIGGFPLETQFCFWSTWPSWVISWWVTRLKTMPFMHLSSFTVSMSSWWRWIILMRSLLRRPSQPSWKSKNWTDLPKMTSVISITTWIQGPPALKFWTKLTSNKRAMFLFLKRGPNHQIKLLEELATASVISWIKWTIKSVTEWSLSRRLKSEKKDSLHQTTLLWWLVHALNKLLSRFWLRFKPITSLRRLRGISIVSSRCTELWRTTITCLQILMHPVLLPWKMFIVKAMATSPSRKVMDSNKIWMQLAETAKMSSRTRKWVHQIATVMRIVDTAKMKQETASVLKDQWNQIRRLINWEVAPKRRKKMGRLMESSPQAKIETKVASTVLKIPSNSIRRSNKNWTGSRYSCRKEWWESHRVFHKVLFMNLLTKPSIRRPSLLLCLIMANGLTMWSILPLCHWLGPNTSRSHLHWAREMTITTLWLWFALLFGSSCILSSLYGSPMTLLRAVSNQSSVYFRCSCIHLVLLSETSKNSLISRRLFQSLKLSCLIKRSRWPKLILHKSSRWLDWQA